MPEEESYQIIPVTPIRRLEKRLDGLERGGTVPQLQNLMNQIIELIRSNQKIVNDVIRANTELRNELSRIPPKMDDMIMTMKNFIGLVEAAGKDEISSPSPESMKPLEDLLKKMVDQNEKLLEGNEAVVDQLNILGKKMRGSTPVSRIVSAYPGMRIRRDMKRREIK